MATRSARCAGTTGRKDSNGEQQAWPRAEMHGGEHIAARDYNGRMKAPTTVEIVWERELVFAGRSGEAAMVLDSAGKAGPSPVQALVFALAGCMGMDVVHILKKGRHDLRGVRVVVVAERAQDDPHRVTAVSVDFTVTGAVPKEQVERAIALSHEKYCSVWHSMRQDIRFESKFSVAP